MRRVSLCPSIRDKTSLRIKSFNRAAWSSFDHDGEPVELFGLDEIPERLSGGVGDDLTALLDHPIAPPAEIVEYFDGGFKIQTAR